MGPRHAKRTEAQRDSSVHDEDGDASGGTGRRQTSGKFSVSCVVLTLLIACALFTLSLGAHSSGGEDAPHQTVTVPKLDEFEGYRGVDPDADYLVRRRRVRGVGREPLQHPLPSSSVPLPEQSQEQNPPGVLSGAGEQPLPLDGTSKSSAVPRVGEEQSRSQTCPTSLKRTPLWTPEEVLARYGGTTAFCQRFGRTPRKTTTNATNSNTGNTNSSSSLPKVYYGVMLNFELDMLEVALHELGPVVDKIVIVESTSTHSLEFRQLVWPRHLFEQRWRPFRHKIKHRIWYLDPLIDKASGWDIERGQREGFLYQLVFDHIPPGSIVLANLDLDEIPSRDTLLFWKYCDAQPSDMYVHRVNFRYHFGCLQPQVWVDRNAPSSVFFYWPHTNKDIREKLNMIYKARSMTKALTPQPSVDEISLLFLGTLQNDTHSAAGNGGSVEKAADKAGNARALRPNPNVLWHLSSFGSVKEVMKKNQHSPHPHLRAINESEVQRMRDSCDTNGQLGNTVSLPSRALPVLVQNNLCYFQRHGWLGP